MVISNISTTARFGSSSSSPGASLFLSTAFRSPPIGSGSRSWMATSSRSSRKSSRCWSSSSSPNLCWARPCAGTTWSASPSSPAPPGSRSPTTRTASSNALDKAQELHLSSGMSASRILVVGAGFSGAVIARELAERLDAKIVIIDERDHVAGNCHTERDADTGVMVHKYGAHIFHTSREDVWKYVTRFSDFGPYVNRVKASTPRGVFPLPINLMTINHFFGRRFSPAEARKFIATLGDPSIGEPRNFEEQALKFVGRELYETFFYGYTKKQWGCEPRELAASLLKRLPVRFNYDDSYFSDRYQGIPVDGYTAIVQRLLDHEKIEVKTGTPWQDGMGADFAHVIFTGPIDGY